MDKALKRKIRRLWRDRFLLTASILAASYLSIVQAYTLRDSSVLADLWDAYILSKLNKSVAMEGFDGELAQATQEVNSIYVEAIKRYQDNISQKAVQTITIGLSETKVYENVVIYQVSYYFSEAAKERTSRKITKYQQFYIGLTHAVQEVNSIYAEASRLYRNKPKDQFSQTVI